MIIDEIPPEYTIVKDNNGEYPDLYLGERRIVKNGVKGIVSEGYLIKTVNGKTVSEVRVRRDRYLSVGGVIAEGTAIPPERTTDDAAGENIGAA